jgi:cystathionine beta-lyase
VPNRELKTALRRQISASGYSNVNTMAIVACEAAYRDGGQWYEAMHRYVRENIAWAKQFVQKNLPGVTMAEHEGTYLIWLDFRGTGLDAALLEHKIRCEAKLWLDSGEMFGESGTGFQRINVACPRKTLEEAMERLRKSLNS